MLTSQSLAGVLRNSGFKVTPQRLAVYEALANTKAHPNAELLYNELRPKYPSMSFATVYKTVEILNELGSPRLIARSIIDAAGVDDSYAQTEYYEDEQEETPEDMFGGNTHIFTMNSTKFKLGCLLSVIIFIFIIYLLFHIFNAMMIVLGPVIIVGLIVALIMNLTGR